MTLTLDQLTLQSGSHQTREDGVCIMEAVAWLAGETHTDRPQCASSIITNYAMDLNDTWNDTQRQKLIPYIPKIINTKDEHDNERGLLAIDWLIRTYTPTWLKLANLTEQAEDLENQPPITDWSALPALREGPIATAKKDASAAGAAAREVLEPTVSELQESALELLDRMCHVGRAT